MEKEYRTPISNGAKNRNLQKERDRERYPVGVEGDAEGGVEGGGEGGICGGFRAEGDEPDSILVDPDPGYGAVDLEAGLEVKDGAVRRKVDDHQRRRRSWLVLWPIFRRGRRQRAAAFGVGVGDVAGKVGFFSLPAHCLIFFGVFWGGGWMEKVKYSR